MQKFDIAICGAGPVGLTLALLLVKRGVDPSDIVLIDAKTAEQSKQDQRTIALSYGSQQILEATRAWPDVHLKATEIHQIHVSRRGHFGRTLIDRDEHRVPALGYVARYGDIIQALTLMLNKKLTFLRPATVSTMTQTESHVQIHLENQHVIEASIVVQAEGGFFDKQTPRAKHHDYQQTAVIAHVKTSTPIAGRAYERFTGQGPLALLPQDNGYALVWCVRPDQAVKLMALHDEVFLSKLHSAFGERLGRFISCTPRFSFPLGLNAQTSAPAGRCITIGNAAQTLHPVAGQGLNLGLRDAFVLAQFLSNSTGPASLHDFYRARQSDRNMTIQLTDQLANMFASSPDGSLRQTLFSAGLGLLDLCTPAQQWLAEHMMFGSRP